MIWHHAIKYLKRSGVLRLAAVAYRADDWCVWPVLVVQPRSPIYKITLVSLQWLRRGIGLAVCCKKEK